MKRSVSRGSLTSRVGRASNCAIAMSAGTKPQKGSAGSGVSGARGTRGASGRRSAQVLRSQVERPASSGKRRLDTHSTPLGGPGPHLQAKGRGRRSTVARLASAPYTSLHRRPTGEMCAGGVCGRVSSAHPLTPAHNQRAMHSLPSTPNCLGESRHFRNKHPASKNGRNVTSASVAVVSMNFSNDQGRKRSLSRDCLSKTSRSRSPPLKVFSSDVNHFKHQKLVNNSAHFGASRKRERSQQSKSPHTRGSPKKKICKGVKSQSASFRNICLPRKARAALERKCFSGINDRVISWMSYKSSTKSESSYASPPESHQQGVEETDKCKATPSSNIIALLSNTIKRKKTPKRKSRRSVYLEKQLDCGTECIDLNETEITESSKENVEQYKGIGKASKSSPLTSDNIEKSPKQNSLLCNSIEEVSKKNLFTSSCDAQSLKQKLKLKITSKNRGIGTCVRDSTILSNCSQQNTLTYQKVEKRINDISSPLLESEELLLLDDIIFLASCSPQNGPTKEGSNEDWEITEPYLENSFYVFDTYHHCIADIDEISYNPNELNNDTEKTHDRSSNSENKETNSFNIKANNSNKVLTSILFEVSKQHKGEEKLHVTDKTSTIFSYCDKEQNEAVSKCHVTVRDAEDGANSSLVDKENTGATIDSKTLTLKSECIETRKESSCTKITNVNLAKNGDINNFEVTIDNNLQKTNSCSIPCICKTSSCASVIGTKVKKDRKTSSRVSNPKLANFMKKCGKFHSNKMQSEEPPLRLFFDNLNKKNKINSLTEIHRDESTAKANISDVLKCQENKGTEFECQTLSHRNIITSTEPVPSLNIKHNMNDFEKNVRKIQHTTSLENCGKGVPRDKYGLSALHKNIEVTNTEKFENKAGKVSISSKTVESMGNDCHPCDGIQDSAIKCSKPCYSKSTFPENDSYINNSHSVKHKICHKSISNVIRDILRDCSNSDISKSNTQEMNVDPSKTEENNLRKRRKCHGKQFPNDTAISRSRRGDPTNIHIPIITYEKYKPLPPTSSSDANISLSENTSKLDEIVPISGRKRKSVSFKIPIDKNAYVRDIPSIHFSQTRHESLEGMYCSDKVSTYSTVDIPVKYEESGISNSNSILSGTHSITSNDYYLLQSQILSKKSKSLPNSLFKSNSLKLGEVKLRNVARKGNCPLITRQEKLKKTKAIHRYGRTFSSKAPIWCANGDMWPIESAYSIINAETTKKTEQLPLGSEVSKIRSSPTPNSSNSQSRILTPPFDEHRVGPAPPLPIVLSHPPPAPNECADGVQDAAAKRPRPGSRPSSKHAPSPPKGKWGKARHYDCFTMPIIGARTAF